MVDLCLRQRARGCAQGLPHVLRDSQSEDARRVEADTVGQGTGWWMTAGLLEAWVVGPRQAVQRRPLDGSCRPCWVHLASQLAARRRSSSPEDPSQLRP